MSTRPALLALTAVLLVAHTSRARPLEVSVLSRVEGSDSVPDASEKLVRQGKKVTLHLAVSGQGLPVIADVERVRPGKSSKAVRARPPDSVEGRWQVRWFRVEPVDHSVSNTDPEFHWHELRYRDVPIDACDDRFSCPALVKTTVLADRGGLGTMTFRASVRLGQRSGASPGAEKRYRGGLTDAVARVTVRRDDTYLGHLTELFNTPYIWGSAGDARVHQAERRIGSDCADFVTYGLRRLGHDVPYTSTWQLERFTRRLYDSASPDEDGVYRTQQGDPVPVSSQGVRPGDLLLFRGHVGAFVRDEAPVGVLSSSDVMIHTCWREPEEVPVGATEFARASVRLLRWKALDKAPAGLQEVSGNR